MCTCDSITHDTDRHTCTCDSITHDTDRHTCTFLLSNLCLIFKFCCIHKQVNNSYMYMYNTSNWESLRLRLRGPMHAVRDSPWISDIHKSRANLLVKSTVSFHVSASVLKMSWSWRCFEDVLVKKPCPKPSFFLVAAACIIERCRKCDQAVSLSWNSIYCWKIFVGMFEVLSVTPKSSFVLRHMSKKKRRCISTGIFGVLMG